tara:strand:+ start:375 stop:584 length:210 start_codon:yes stop_codon:yes gene_type:complete
MDNMTDEMWFELAKGQFKFEDNPSDEQINAKAQELKNARQTVINKKASGKQKLKDLGLDDDEIKALMGA